MRLVKMSQNPELFTSEAVRGTDVTVGMSERDRRILLRDMERRNRMQGGQSNQQQYGGPLVVEAQPDIFGQQKASAKVEQSKRDQAWQQKLQQRAAEIPQYKPLELPSAFSNVEMDLPIFNFRQEIDFGPPLKALEREEPQFRGAVNAPTQPVRTSMAAQKLQQAKELDSSFNLDEHVSPQTNFLVPEVKPVNGKPGYSPLLNKYKAMENQGVLNVLGNNEIDIQRREEVKKMVKQEYNNYVSNQPQRKVGNIYEGELDHPIAWNRPSSATRQIPDQQFVQAGRQQMGGLMQIGQSEEDRLKRQRELREVAQHNFQAAAAKKEPAKDQRKVEDFEHRRKQLVDQVFEEVLEQHKVKQPAPLPPRQWSAVDRRQSELAKLQNQSSEDPFFRARLKQEEQKRVDAEKKREYAAILNQQMEAKRQRETKSTPAAVQYQPQAPSPYNQQMYPLQHGQNQPQNQAQYLAFPQQTFAPELQARDQRDLFLDAREHKEFLSKANEQEEFPLQRRDPKMDQIRQQEEYRMELQKQIQMREEISKQGAIQNDLPKSIHEPKYAVREPQVGNRPRTDVTRNPDSVDPVKEQKRLKYQEELRTQMEEQKRRKEEAKRREMETDLEIERKLKQQRVVMSEREREEIMREGKRDVRDLDDRPKRQVRRDQFQTSDENHAAADLPKYVEPQKPQATPQERFSNVSSEPKYQPQFEPSKLPNPFLEVQKSHQMEPSRLMDPAKKQTLDLFGKPEPFVGFEVQKPIQLEEERRTEMIWQQQKPMTPGYGQPYNEEWMMQQRQQASKMFDDQQRMIVLYQQALEQILQYRNQYFEQAMQMRENILKEREQLFEYERLKQAQILEINQLKAVHNKLSNMMETAHTQRQPILDKKVQNDLNDYINKQKESILNLSRSSTQLAEAIKQNRQMFPELQEKRPDPYEFKEMKVSSARIEVPRTQRMLTESHFINMDVDETDDLHRRVNELENAIHNSQENGFYGASQIEDFEKSLCAESKLVRVPVNNLSARAQRKQEENLAPKEGQKDLMATWNDEKHGLVGRPDSASPLRLGQHIKDQRTVSSEKGSQEKLSSSTPKNKLLGKLAGNNKSPLNSSAMPYTIEEMPTENEEDKALQSSSLKVADLSPRPQPKQSAANTHNTSAGAKGFSDHDFNNRESSAERSPKAYVQRELNENLRTIERMINQHSLPGEQSSAVMQRKQTTTGSSFYDKTLHQEKIQQAHQQEEVQKQMARIFGNTSQSYYQQSNDHQVQQEDAYEMKNHKSSTLLLRNQSSERFDGHASQTSQTRGAKSRSKAMTLAEARDEPEMWEDPDLVPPPVFPTYDDENSQEMVVENNSSVGVQTRGRTQMMSDEGLNFYMGGLGQIPEALNTLSPTESRLKQEPVKREVSPEIVDETVDPEEDHKSPQQQSELQNSTVSGKKLYMDEITALIKKATSQTNLVVQAAENNKRRSPFRPSQQPLQTPHFDTSDDKQVDQKRNSQNDQILADLDKIISNLEAQQKNMQTFGMQKLVPEADEEQEDRPDTIDEEPEESVAQSTGRKWMTLKEARDTKKSTIHTDDQEQRAPMGKSARAPLDPKFAPRPKSGRSVKSKGSRGRSAAGDPSPQRVGKYTQMALQNTSQSPMRAGKYTNMALQNSPLNAVSDNGSVTKSPSALKSPQRVGKYAAMALNNSNLQGVSTQSPGRVGKFAMMALQNQRELADVETMSQKYSRQLSGSRERQRSTDRLVQQLEHDVDSRLGFDNNENIVNNGQPILRPLSSISKSSRYNNGTPAAQPFSSSIVMAPEFRSNADFKAQQSEGMQTRTQMRATGNIKTETKAYGNGQKLQVAQYFSDEDEEPRPLAYQTSGQTNLTEQLK